MENIIECTECGGQIANGEGLEIREGVFVCETCAEFFFTCDVCGRVENENYGHWIASREETVCNRCLDTYYSRCAECGEYVRDCDNHNGGWSDNLSGLL